MILRKLYKLLEKTGPRSLFVRSATEYALGLFYFVKDWVESHNSVLPFICKAAQGAPFFATYLISTHRCVAIQNYLIDKCNNPYHFLRNISYYYGKNYPVWGFKFKNYQMDRQGNISSVKDFLEALV